VPGTAVADWRPTARREALLLRARLLAQLRAFFAARAVLEVETPALGTGATTDPQIDSLSVEVRGAGLRYLHTSPEFAMKRLLAAGSGDIYQVCKVFRDGERGRQHNVEFTLLEWYRLGVDHHALMAEVAALVHALLGPARVAQVEQLSFHAAVGRHAALDPSTASTAECAGCLQRAGIDVPRGADRGALLDLIVGELVGPRLGHGGACFVYDYPADRAALARIRRDDPPVAERFELYVDGIELANGFHELGDAEEQRSRFRADLDARARAGRESVPMDKRLLAALAAGLPPCSGVALGFDRLVMLAAGADHIEDVIAFPTERS
jgi:elongation factor P--(R)-beta-lysine ligase